MDHSSDAVTTAGQSPCPTLLLADSPSAEDRFGPHGRLAHAIADLVRREEGGKSVGLSGKWGSGKSTVVSLARTVVETNPSHRFWIFDAWAHEGDHLRRTFLESLISFLRRQRWVDDARWNRRIEELARRRKTTEQKTSPRLSRFGMALVATVALVPIGTATLKYGFDQGVAIVGNGHPNIAFWLGLLLSVGPVVLLVSLWAWLQFTDGSKEELADVYSLLVQRAVTHTTTETTESPEPTSLEFEKIFTDLVGEALGERERRLILVIDNLDRIEPSDALKVWATLQTFLNQRADAPWMKQLWVMMPFDPVAIRRLWIESPAGAGGLAASFLDKTFQVQFHVPPPLMTDWREFLLSTLREALPGHSGDEFHDVYRVVAVHQRQGLTPRDIKIFVNQLGVLHRQRGHDFPLNHLAYYALLRRDPSLDISAGLLTGSIPDVEVASLLGEGIADHLAALEFGQTPAKANQILLLGPTQEALRAGDAVRLKDLQGRTEGAAEVLEQALSRASADWTKDSGTYVLHAACALAEAGLLEATAGHRAASLTRSVIAAARKVENIAPLTPLVEQGLIHVVRRSRDVALARRLFSAYASSVATHTPNAPPVVQELAVRAAHLVDSLESVIKDCCAEGVQLPGDLSVFTTAMSAVRSRAPNVMPSWKRLRPGSPLEVVGGELVALVQQGAFNAGHIDVVYVLSRQLKEVAWAPFVDAVRARFSTNAQLPSAETGPLAMALYELRALGNAGKQLTALVQEGYLAHQLRGCASDPPNLARCLFAYAHVNVGLAVQAQVHQSQGGYNLMQQQIQNPTEKFVEALADLAEEYGVEDLPLDLYGANALAKPLARLLLQRLSGLRVGQYFTPDRVESRWRQLRELVDPGVLQSADPPLIIKTLMSRPFRAEYSDLYRVLLEAQEEDLAWRDWCAAGLRVIESEAWSDAIETDGAILGLLLACARLPGALKFGHELRDALRRQIGAAAEGSTARPVASDDWPLLLASLAEDQRDTFLDDVMSVLRDAGGRATGPLLQICERVLPDVMIRQDPEFATRVLEPMVEQGNLAGLEWIGRCLEREPGLLMAAKGSHRSAIASRIKKDLDSDQASETRAKLLRGLGDGAGGR